MLLTADRGAGVTAGLDQVAIALRALRGRLVALAEGMDAPAWTGPSRCERWTAHDVLRHVRDGCRLHAGGLQRDGNRVLEEFDTRRTPQQWLEQSTGQGPDVTLDELRRWGDAEGEALDHRLMAPDDEVVSGPYGPIHWTLLTAHVFWDAWLHERDVSQLVDGGIPSTEVEDAVAALYALFLASMVVLRQGQTLATTVTLTGTGRHSLASVVPDMSSCRRSRHRPRRISTVTCRQSSTLWPVAARSWP